jgi:cytochrome c oxidase cbb3-type subunit I/II
MEMENFKYDNRIVKNFAYATMLWGFVGMLVGVLCFSAVLSCIKF